jgi:hypothetical protein
VPTKDAPLQVLFSESTLFSPRRLWDYMIQRMASGLVQSQSLLASRRPFCFSEGHSGVSEGMKQSVDRGSPRDELFSTVPDVGFVNASRKRRQADEALGSSDREKSPATAD